MTTELDWEDKLSFENLKTNGLINSINEWEYIKDVLADVPSNKYVTTWLKNQSRPFRVSHLMHKLMAGYTRTDAGSSMDKEDALIPIELQAIIIRYCNFIFVKIFFSKNSKSTEYKLRTFDTNYFKNI